MATPNNPNNQGRPNLGPNALPQPPSQVPPPAPSPVQGQGTSPSLTPSPQGGVTPEMIAAAAAAVGGLGPSADDVGQSVLPTLATDIDLDTFLRMAIAQGVSDIHLRVGHPPVMRKDGDMVKTKLPEITEEAMMRFAKGIIPSKILPKLKNKLDFDFGFEFESVARFRVNLFYESGHLGMVMRLIPLTIPTLDDLNHPQIMTRFTEFNQGLVLVTGPTGSGKSTTLAAILNTINSTRQKHIITLEDPIEYAYKSQECVVTQRQLGLDTDSFPNGIKYALRQDPDVLLIGEMRDRETMMAALHAAETGHLVFSTLHTVDSVQTISRIINAFEPFEREPLRAQLAGVLQGTISQRLVKKADGVGRVAVAEIMLVTPAIRDYIMRDEMDEIYQLLNAGEFEGTCSLNNALYRAVRNEQITPEDALEISENPSEMQQMLRGAFHGSGGM